MANPQQPELRRSQQTPSLTPDAIEGELEAKDRPDPKGKTGPVPRANKPGSGSGPVQDKPDLDDFAAKLGADGGSSERSAPAETVEGTAGTTAGTAKKTAGTRTSAASTRTTAGGKGKTPDGKQAGGKTAASKTAGDKTAASKTAGDKTAASKTAGDKTAASSKRTTAASKTAASKTAASSKRTTAPERSAVAAPKSEPSPAKASTTAAPVRSAPAEARTPKAGSTASGEPDMPRAGLTGSRTSTRRAGVSTSSAVGAAHKSSGEPTPLRTAGPVRTGTAQADVAQPTSGAGPDLGSLVTQPLRVATKVVLGSAGIAINVAERASRPARHVAGRLVKALPGRD